MADMNDPVPLPPGWDCKYDSRSSRYYYVNHLTKTTSWEDPRIRHRIFQHSSPMYHNSNAIGEYIPLQHGSPDLRRNHVYPTNSHASPLRAFQMPLTYSPKAFSHHQDFNSSTRSSPLASRASNQTPSRLQETSLMPSAQETDQLVAKIGAMFPTVSETHIRILLKKYYNREAVVMSALQVEKHPITTPGPYTPPPSVKHNLNSYMVRGGSPLPRPGSGCSGSFIGSPRFGENLRYSPRPQSPKMKLRYMKNVFPDAEEIVILDVLTSNDNNVQKTAEALAAMGYKRREMKPPQLQSRKVEEEKLNSPEKSKPSSPPRMKSLEEKTKMKGKLQEEFPKIPEQVINFAIESANYHMDITRMILNFLIDDDDDEDDKKKNKKNENMVEIKPSGSTSQHLKVVNSDEISVRSDRSKNKSNQVLNKSEETFSLENGHPSKHSDDVELAFCDYNYGNSKLEIKKSHSKDFYKSRSGKTTGDSNRSKTDLKKSSKHISKSRSGEVSKNDPAYSKVEIKQSSSKDILQSGNDEFDKNLNLNLIKSISREIKKSFSGDLKKSLSGDIKKSLKNIESGENQKSNDELVELFVKDNMKPSNSKKSLHLQDEMHTPKTDDSKVISINIEESKSVDLEVGKPYSFTSTESGKIEEFHSHYITPPKGANNHLHKGPNNDILLPDYVAWNGANPKFAMGPNKSIAKGPNSSLLLSSRCQPKGPNPNNHKGPLFGLSKGSIYAQLKSVLCESRSK